MWSPVPLWSSTVARLAGSPCTVIRPDTFAIVDLLEAFSDELHDGVDADPFLFHGVALAHGDLVVLQRLEVDSHAERRTDLVLAPVALPDRLGDVDVRDEVRADRSRNLFCYRHQIGMLGERQD